MKKSRRDREKKGRGFVLVIIELLLAVVILVLLFGAGAYFLCPLQTVTVEGTDLYTSEEIQNYILDDEYSTNTVYVYVKNKLFPKGDAEFIDHFNVQMKSPRTGEAIWLDISSRVIEFDGDLALYMKLQDI